MKVGLLCHGGVGGSVRIAMGLAHALAQRDCAVHVFARSAPLGLSPPVGVKLHTLALPMGNHVSTALDIDWTSAEKESLAMAISAVVKTDGLDILHFHYAVPFADVLDRVRRSCSGRCPALIGTLHGTDVSLNGGRMQTEGTLAALIGRLDAITTVSRHHAARAAGVFGMVEPPQVIPNFVDTVRFHPRRDPLDRGDPPMIMHVSNFRPVKQPESMARIFIDVRARTAATLGLVGDGEGLPAVKSCLARAGLESACRFFGVRGAVETLLRDASILVVTSREESFCLAALEAAAVGVPVVAPRIGGLPEVVRDGETGLLFEPGNERQAVNAVLRLLAEPALRAALGRAATAWARTFDTPLIVSRYLELYRRTNALRRQRAQQPLQAMPH